MAEKSRKRLLKIGLVLMMWSGLLSKNRAALGMKSSAFVASSGFKRRMSIKRVPYWPPKTPTYHFRAPSGPAVRSRLFATKSADESSTTQPPLDYSYEEFASLAAEIRRHDALYYNDASNIELSDEEYDALVELEAALCQKYPKYLARIQKESGLGKRATRYGGRVGSDATRETAVKISDKLSHVAPMLSLDNVHNTAQLQQWLVRVQKRLLKTGESFNATDSSTTIQLITEPKLDGLSLSLRYQRDGDKSPYKFQWAATRGDGREGQNVTTAAAQANIMPQQLNWDKSDAPDILEVRGEVVLPLSKFQQLSSNFSNARNAASGILLRKTEDTEDKESQKLRSYLKFYAYDIVLEKTWTDTEVRGFEDGVSVRALLEQWGFHVPEPVIVTDLDLSVDENENATMQVPPPLLEYYNALMQHRLGENSTAPGPKKSASRFKWGEYEMDGAVHKVSSLLFRSELGSSNRSPRWAVAHKFPSQTTVTSLLGIEVQVGRTGALTPVAILEPVDLGGVSVRRATLHNFGHMQQVLGDGGRTVPRGAKVMVRRAGDVIPQVVQRVVQDATPDGNDGNADISLDAPLHCPACGAETFVDEPSNSTTSVGQVMRCGGPSLLCPPRAVSALAHAFSRDALDVTGLSEARIQQLVDEGILHRPSDLFRLVPGKDASSSLSLIDQISELPGWGPKSAQNLADAAKRIAKNGISLGRFIFSLNIRHVGQFSSNLIASTYGTAGAFLEAVEEASRIEDDDDLQTFSLLRGDDEREGTKGIGPVLLSSLAVFSRQSELVQAAKELAKAIPVLEEKRQVSSARSSTPDVNEKQLPWTGLTVVFTGSLPGMSRTKAHDVAREMGAKSTPGSVSKSTDIVVVGAKGGKKAEIAQELGIPVLDADEFLSLVDQFRQSS